MSSDQEAALSVVGNVLCGAAFLVLLILKLCGLIAWSWWWVTAPLWIPLVLVALIVATFIVGLLLAIRE